MSSKFSEGRLHLLTPGGVISAADYVDDLIASRLFNIINEVPLPISFDEMSIMNSMSNLFDIEIGNRSRDGCGATLG